uniref:Uncharacterized protein n=1 Tax=Picea glauca TaxID=3330 RepID=A0A101LTW9_PICGL|nr:hypothetical protein ABT39_MTgene3507 [Picea glauca]
MWLNVVANLPDVANVANLHVTLLYLVFCSMPIDIFLRLVLRNRTIEIR